MYLKLQVIDCLIRINEYDDRDFNGYMELFGTSFVGKIMNIIFYWQDLLI